ncbi:Type 1 phosphatases regulator ypi1 [Mortierella alpina]|nr:Type 1 phosphatases regulator ypi1 [Mortierella alpina]
MPYDATTDIYGPEGPDRSIFSGGGSRGSTPVPVGSRLRVAGGGPQPATYGSRTMTLDPTQTNEEDPGAEDHVHGVLELSGEPSEGRRVQWDDDVVDNEHMNKKKSKICCIFKKQKEFGESSDESSSESDSSGPESDGGPAPSGSGKGKGKGRREDGSCDHSDPNHQHHHHRHGASKPKKRVLNEYERMPKGKLVRSVCAMLDRKSGYRRDPVANEAIDVSIILCIAKSSVPQPINQPPNGSDTQP